MMLGTKGLDVKNKKAIIIGAGIAGISCAIRLQLQGFEVEVFEINERAGGKLGELKLGGYRFDTGPSLFTMPQFVEELFLLANRKMADTFSYKKKDIVCNYFFANDKRFTAYANLHTFIQHAASTFQEDPRQIEKYLNNSAIKYKRTHALFLEKSLHKLSTYLRVETLKALLDLRKLDIYSTLHKVNKKYFKNEQLIQLFDRYATYNGSSPYLTPGIMSIIPHLEQHFGTYIPQGGMIAIVNALFDLAESLGVQFNFNKKVDRILVENKKAIGIEFEGQIKPADLIISNMDIVPTYRKLLATEKAPEQILRQERSSSALIFYWGIRGNFPSLDLHNIFFSKNYEAEFNSIFKEQNVADDITIYINISSKDEVNDAPPECENWFVMVNVPPNTNQDWDEIIQRTRKNILRRLSTQLGEDIELLIECEKILDPRTIESNTQSYQGALYGAASNSKFSAFLRHPNFSTQIKQLYFCGGSVHPGGGIPLCLLSAKITSEIIAAHYQK